jgi:hypothetical protein
MLSFGHAIADGKEIIVNPNVLNITAQNYGGGNKNWDIAQDSRGIVYIANNNGLLEFDGMRWTLHNDAECGVVRSVAVDKADRVFTGGFEEFGVWERDNSGQLRYRVLSDMVPAGVFVDEDIWNTHIVDGKVYFQSFARIYAWDYRRVEVIDPHNFILFLKRVGDRLLVHSGDRILELRGDSLGHFANARLNGQPLSTIRVILPTDNPDELLLGSATGGICVLRGGRGGELTEWNSEIDRVVRRYDLNCALRLDNGDYIFGTILNGIYRTDAAGNIINHFTTTGDLQNNTVLSLFRDAGGNVWAGLDKGLARLDYSTDFNFFIDHSGRVGAIYTAKIHRGVLYLGSNRGLFCVPWSEFADYGPLSDVRMIEGTQGQVWTLEEVDGELLCGHNSGVMRVEGESATFIYRDSGVFAMTTTEHGDEKVVVAASYTHPVVLERGGEGVGGGGGAGGGGGGGGKFEYRAGLKPFLSPGRFVEVDHMGNIWIAHMTRNVYRLRTDRAMGEIVSTREFGRAVMGSGGAVTMGKIGGRIVFVAGDRFFLYDNIADSIVPWRQMNELGIRSRQTGRLVSLGEEHHWVVGKNSATLLRSSGEQPEVVRHYDLGRLGVSTVDGYENIAPLNDTLSLVCLDNGFLIHNAAAMSREGESLGAPLLKSAVAYNRQGHEKAMEIAPTEAPRIAHSFNSLRLEYACPDPRGRRLTMQYRVEGLSNAWSDMPPSGGMALERLPRGTYRVHVRAVDMFDRSGGEHVYGFRVRPPLQASGWAVAGYVAAAIGAMFALRVGGRRRVRLRYARRMAMVERQRLEDQNRRLIDQTEALISGKGDWKFVMMHFEQNHKEFFGGVMRRFPNLTPGDLKLCACLRMNLSSKEIASLLNISVRGVEIGRYRLRKKMGIGTTVNLNDYFIKEFNDPDGGGKANGSAKKSR